MRAAVLLALLATALPLGARPLDGSPRERVDAVLRHDDAARTQDDVLAARLAELGAEAVPELFRRLTHVESGDEPGEPPALGDFERDHRVLRLALSRAGVDAASEAVLARGRTVGELVEGLGVLGSLGNPRAAEPLCALVADRDDVATRVGPVRRAFVDAAARLLRETPGAGAAFAEPAAALGEPLQLALVEAIGRAGRADGVATLRALVGESTALDVAIAETVSELWAASGWRLGGEPSAILRPLLDHFEPTVRAAAAVALARVQDALMASRIVGLLTDRDPRVRSAAAWSLRELAGGAVAQDVAGWDRWLATRQHEAARALPQVLERLSSPDPGVALPAVRELGREPLFRREAAGLLARALDHPAPEVARAACDALERLDSPLAAPPLLRALRSGDRGVEHAAWRALRAVLDVDLPLDSDEWEHRIAG